MPVVIVAIAGIALIWAWPSLVVRRLSPKDAARALEPPVADSAEADLGGRRDALSSIAASLGRAARAAYLAATGRREPEPPAFGPELDALVRRARRSRLWYVPLAIGLVLDVSLFVALPAGWAFGAGMVALAILADVVLLTCAIVMLALRARRAVSDAERERFLEAWDQILRDKAGRHRAEAQAARDREASELGRDASVEPILGAELAAELSDVRARLNATHLSHSATLALGLDGFSRQMRLLEASPQRDGHADAAVQTYAEQVVDAVSSLLELSNPTEEDVRKVSAVLELASSALARELARLDDRARLNLDVTKRGTEALYGHRYGHDGR